MNNQFETTPQPVIIPEKQDRTGRNILLIVVIVIVVLCCLCILVAGIGAAAFLIIAPNSVQEIPGAQPVPQMEITTVFDVTPTSELFPFENTPTEEAVAPTAALPTGTPVPPSATSGEGLGVSRQEMIDFYAGEGAFEFGDPIEVQGFELVQGEHTWLCIEANCAAVTLGGPEEELEVISIVVPTSEEDSAQTLVGAALLMTTAGYFVDEETGSDIPVLIMEELIEAQSASQDLETTYENNGFIFLVTYSQDSQNAGLAITRAE